MKRKSWRARDTKFARRQKIFQTRKADRQKGGGNLKENEEDDGNNGMRNGNTAIGDGERCDLRDEKRGNEIRHLQLSDLPLSHQAERKDEEKIYQQGAE